METVDKERIIQESVHGKQVTLPHLIAHPEEGFMLGVDLPAVHELLRCHGIP